MMGKADKEGEFNMTTNSIQRNFGLLRAVGCKEA